MDPRSRLAVVGCGALGSFYGARLARAGRDVHFLLRSDYDAVRRDGVRIENADGGFTVHPGIARHPEEIGPVDIVLVGLKTTANAEFPRLIGPLLGAKTLVVTLQNGLGNEEALAESFGPERVLGGLCFVCLNRIAPGVIRHLAYGRIIMGEYQRPPSDRLRTLASWFAEAGIRCDVTDDLASAHWEKLVWNIAFNGLGVAGAAGWEAVVAGHFPPDAALGPCLATDALLGDPRWEGLVRELMHETIRAARAQGLPVPESAADEQIALTRRMGPYLASTLIDFDRGQPLERESLFGEPLRRARAVGVPTPRLEALYRILGELDARRGAGATSPPIPAAALNQ